MSSQPAAPADPVEWQPVGSFAGTGFALSPLGSFVNMIAVT
jgi:hypothetical protein